MLVVRGLRGGRRRDDGLMIRDIYLASVFHFLSRFSWRVSKIRHECISVNGRFWWAF